MEIYFDNSATTRVSPPVAQLVLELMTQEYGNPSSLHRKGFLAERQLTLARERVAGVLGVDREEIVFTSCGSEANNLAIVGAAMAARRRGSRIITTAVEHESVLAPAKFLAQNGFEAVFIPPEADGRVDPERVAAAVDEKTILVSAMYVNSETGAINDLKAIARGARQKNPSVLLHSDCVQGFGKLPVLPRSWGVDFVTISGHKVHGPKGIGAFYAAKGARALPLYYGSGQEKGLHPGTENTPAACGFGLAAKTLWDNREANKGVFQALRGRLLENLEKMPEVCINSPENGAPYIVNFSVPGIRSEVMIHYLEQWEMYVSSGSACAKGAKSHVLTAMGLSPARIDSAIRVSFCEENTTEQVDVFCRQLEQGIKDIARK